MSFTNSLLIILVLVSVIYVLYQGYHWILRSRSAELVESQDLQAQIRRVQVIDVRQVGEFNESHILGARNIPYTEFKLRYQELRKDKPVFLYDDTLNPASRCANILRKAGYPDVYILKGGFSQWFGKVKSER